MNSIAIRLASFSRVKLLMLLVALPAMASAADIRAWIVLNAGNPAAPETVLSGDVVEKANLVRGGWKVSGAGLLHTEATPDTATVYRMVLMRPKGGVLRMLALTKAEADAHVQAGYILEGAIGQVSTKAGPGLIPVHRFSKGERFLWLISKEDQEWATKAGWTGDKIAFWIWPDQYR